MPRSPSTTVIFDFDGTLADSLEVGVTAYNQIAPLLRVRKMSLAELPRLRTLGPREMLREHQVSLWKLPLLAVAMRLVMKAHLYRVQPVAGVPEALRELRAAGCRLAILSTNSSDNIRRILARHDLALFDFIDGGASLFGKGRALTRILRRENLDPRATFYVGDEVRDMVAASEACVRSVAVAWGYAARSSLQESSPDHIVDRPEQLVPLLSSAVAVAAQ